MKKLLTVVLSMVIGFMATSCAMEEDTADLLRNTPDVYTNTSSHSHTPTTLAATCKISSDQTAYVYYMKCDECDGLIVTVGTSPYNLFTTDEGKPAYFDYTVSEGNATNYKNMSLDKSKVISMYSTSDIAFFAEIQIFNEDGLLAIYPDIRASLTVNSKGNKVVDYIYLN